MYTLQKVEGSPSEEMPTHGWMSWFCQSLDIDVDIVNDMVQRKELII